MSNVGSLIGVGIPAAQAEYLANTPQYAKGEFLFFTVDISALDDGTATGITNGAGYVTATDNGTGDTTLTLDTEASSEIIFVGGGCVGEGFLRRQAVPSTTAIRLICEAADGTNTDLDFQVCLFVPR